MNIGKKLELVALTSQAEYKRTANIAISKLDRCVKIAKEAGLSYGEAQTRGLFKDVV